MTDTNNLDDQDPVVDFVDDPIVAYLDPPFIPRDEFLAPGRSRVFTQPTYGVQNSIFDR